MIFFRSFFIVCGDCASMCYCSIDCKDKDWKIHEHECKIFKDHYETLSDHTERFLLRLYLTLKHFPDERFKSHEIPRTDPPLYRSYVDLKIQPEDVKKDETKFGPFENILKNFHRVGIEFDREELFECFCKIMANTFAIDDDDMFTIGTSIFIVESVFEHSCDPNADLVFNGIDLEVRAIKNISSSEKITISWTDRQYSREDRQKLLKESFYLTCLCNKCSADNEDGKFCLIVSNLFYWNFLFFFFADIDYEDFRRKLVKMDDLFGEHKFKECLNLGQELLLIYHKIYGEYNQVISRHMFRVCCLLIGQSDVGRLEKVSFLKKTKDFIKITHGHKHRLHNSLQQLDFL